MGGEEVDELVDRVVIDREVDVEVEAAFISGIDRVNTGDVVVFYEHRDSGGSGGMEDEWGLEVLFGRWVVEIDGVCV